jgi:ubiquitin C-terminal hydrolase
MKEDVYIDRYLKISDSMVTSGLKIGAFNTKLDQTNSANREYELFSVVQHIGSSAIHGHYVCYTLDSQDDWVKFDDKDYKKISEETVLDNTQGYLLFYKLEV